MTKTDLQGAAPLLTHAEAAARIGVSTRTLNRYVASGALSPMHLPSGYRRYTTAQIDALLSKGKSK